MVDHDGSFGSEVVRNHGVELVGEHGDRRLLDLGHRDQFLQLSQDPVALSDLSLVQLSQRAPLLIDLHVAHRCLHSLEVPDPPHQTGQLRVKCARELGLGALDRVQHLSFQLQRLLQVVLLLLLVYQLVLPRLLNKDLSVLPRVFCLL